MRYFLYKLAVKFLPANWRNSIGQSRLLQPLRDMLLRPKGQTEIIEVKSAIGDFVFSAPMHVALKAAERGIEPSICRLVQNYCKAEMICLDVGASYGFISLVLGKQVQTSGKVFAFETNLDSFALLEKNIRQNKLQTVCHAFNLAVSSSADKTVPLVSSGGSSLIAQSDTQADTWLPSTSIDHFAIEQSLARIDFIKIDVDGLEYPILLGAQKIIEAYKPVLIVEVNQDFSEMLSFLRQAGYELFTLQGQPVTETMDTHYLNIVACSLEQKQRLWR